MKALLDFMQHFGIAPEVPPRQLLDSVVTAFARLPYENITKIIKRAEAANAERARRYPEEVIRDHIKWGTGGTCFSLTSALAQLVRDLGWRAEFILANRSYGQNTHCALLVWVDGAPHLLDPGFLIVNPIQLRPEGEQEVNTSFNRLILKPEDNPDQVSLSTVRKSGKTYRLTYKTSPVNEGEFLEAWDASFGWDMMTYPLLTRTSDSKQIYLNGTKLQISDGDSVEKREIPADTLVAGIAAEFNIHPTLVARAVTLLKQRSEIIGKTSSR
jgi:arylamine N-acetyltransferase